MEDLIARKRMLLDAITNPRPQPLFWGEKVVAPAASPPTLIGLTSPSSTTLAPPATTTYATLFGSLALQPSLLAPDPSRTSRLSEIEIKRLEVNARQPTFAVRCIPSKYQSLKAIPSLSVMNSTKLTALPSRDLATAVSRNDLEAVRALIEARVDLRPTNWYDTPALVTAAQHDLLEMVQLLVAAGAQVNNGYERLPLHCAAENGNLEMVRFLLESGAYLEGREIGDRTALMVAASAGQLSIVELLTRQGASLKAINITKETALMLAAKGKHQQVYDYLNHLWQTRFGQSPETAVSASSAASNRIGTLSNVNSLTPHHSTSTEQSIINPGQQRLLEDLQAYVSESTASAAPAKQSAKELKQGFQEIVQAMDRPIEIADKAVAPTPRRYKNRVLKWLAS